ncbi:MAG TPA: hypothetical protein VJT72_14660, partial [Pseudonocardiaceae bacterium]|nr:hypothetical protein [Pseudonocardiaceae bacterium]
DIPPPEHNRSLAAMLSRSLSTDRPESALVLVVSEVAGDGAGITLAIARVIGETAPLLITVGLTAAVNLNPFDGRMATLPVFSYYSYATPGIPRAAFIDRAWAAALVLIAIVMALNLVARLISRLFAPKTG